MVFPLVRDYLLPRKLVCVSSNNAPQNTVIDFLNKFFTQSIPAREPPQGIHGLFLDNKGRVISDAIIVTGRCPKSTSAFIDCPIEGYEWITNHLRTYSEFSDHQLEFTPQETSVFCELSVPVDKQSSGKSSIIHETINPEVSEDSLVIQDPRSPMHQVRRIYVETGNVMMTEVEKRCLTLKEYTILRYSLGIAEGLSEFASGKSLPTQYNYDLLRGIDFEKGCYLGQELTRRAHFHGSTRKRIVPFLIDESPSVPRSSYRRYSTEPANESIQVYESETERYVADLVALEGCHGLVMHRYIQEFKKCPKPTSAFCRLNGNTTKLKIFRPKWWPYELMNERI